MSQQKTWQKRVPELTERAWEVEAIRDRLNKLRQNGFSPKYADWAAVKANRDDGRRRSGPILTQARN